MRRPLRGLGLAVTLALGVSVATAGPPVPGDRLTQGLVRLAVLLDDGRALVIETLVAKPKVSGRLPLAVITHVEPREGEARRQMFAGHRSFQAEELARRGDLAVVVMRRGYGASAGVWAESSGQCDAADHERAARASALDLRGALRSLASWPMVDPERVIAIGESAGGIGAVALAANPPAGLRVVINLAGGRGSHGPNDVCREDCLIDAYASLGETVRVPSLWI